MAQVFAFFAAWFKHKKEDIMETKKRTTRKMDLLTAVEQVVELSKGSHLDAEFFLLFFVPNSHVCIMYWLYVPHTFSGVAMS